MYIPDATPPPPSVHRVDLLYLNVVLTQHENALETEYNSKLALILVHDFVYKLQNIIIPITITIYYYLT